MQKRSQLIKTHLLWFAIAAVIWGGYSILEISCPVSRLLGFPCPTCGVTRALTALLQGQLSEYLRYHALALPLVFTVLLAVHVKNLKSRWAKTLVWLLIAAVLILNIGYYIVRIQNGFGF